MKITDGLKKKITTALVFAGVSLPSAYYASTHTIPSEGFITELHLDPVGLPTFCAGHLAIKGEKVKQSYTEQECIDIFVEDWVKHEKLLDVAVKVPYRSEWMRAGITDFTFNKGIGNVQSSTMLRRLNAKRYDEACDELLKWVYAKKGGKSVRLRGLELRASKQWKACMGQEPLDYRKDIERWNFK